VEIRSQHTYDFYRALSRDYYCPISSIAHDSPFSYCHKIQIPKSARNCPTYLNFQFGHPPPSWILPEVGYASCICAGFRRLWPTSRYGRMQRCALKSHLYMYTCYCCIISHVQLKLSLRAACYNRFSINATHGTFFFQLSISFNSFNYNLSARQRFISQYNVYNDYHKTNTNTCNCN